MPYKDKPIHGIPYNLNTRRLPQVADLGERGIIDKFIRPILSQRNRDNMLDDCAVLELGQLTLLLSTDQAPRVCFMEMLEVGTPEDIGHFHVVANISDIAAMGGEPLGILLALTLEGNESGTYLASYLDGIRQALTEYRIDLLGGDTKQASIRSTTISILGRISHGTHLLRRGTEPGDQVFVTPGKIGHCLKSYVIAARLRSTNQQYTLARPQAMIKFGQMLAKKGIATSCMDMSDGVLATAVQLEQINGVSFFIDPKLIPLSTIPFRDTNCNWNNLILNCGGDFGLMFTTRPADAATVLDMGAVKIGHVLSADAAEECAKVLNQNGIKPNGWEHFKTVGDISNEIRNFT